MKTHLAATVCLTIICTAMPLATGAGESQLEGVLFSASATVPAGASAALLTEVAEGQTLVVTQYCKSSVFGPELFGSQLGRVPAEVSTVCTSYVPGVVFGGGQSVGCKSFFGPVGEPVACLINGVIQ